jgi:hypothetical protein
MKIVNTLVRSFRGALIASDTNFHFEDMKILGVRTMNLRNRLIAIAAVSLFLSSASAMATDRKVHNGSMCQPADGRDRLDTSTGGAFNANPTTFIFVTCPSCGTTRKIRMVRLWRL